MAHHSEDQISPELARFILRDRERETIASAMRDAAKKEGLGATGKFPLGKLQESDEGELRLAVAHTPEKVVLNFGKPVAWIGFTADQADEIANLLHEHARAIRG